MIVDPFVLLAFVPAALMLNLTPGADMLFCFGQGLRGGPRAALAADVGIALGCMVHVTIAGAGLGAILDRAPVTFEVIRWIGVAYLVWLAWSLLRAPRDSAIPPVRPARAFREGLVVNLTNPKVILFVLAFLPQFVDASRAVLPQFLLLGGVLSLGGLIVNGVVGVCAGGIGRRLAASPGFGRWMGRAAATVFVALAARLALVPRG
jgi:threonine/homoserine/homoserine lactone efflux protein